MELDELKFERDDCIVQLPLVDVVNSDKRPPRWGAQAGNVINGRMGNAIVDEIRSVSVTDVATGSSHTVSEFTIARNKEIAFIQVERLVNKLIEQMKAAQVDENEKP